MQGVPNMTDSVDAAKPKRYVIRVIFQNGDVAFLRHGPVIGSGPIVRFPNRRKAEEQLAVIREGLDEGVVAQIVPIGTRQADGVIR